MSDLEADLQAELARLEQLSLRRQRASRGEAALPRIDLGGRELINFAANDYLGLAADPRVAEALAAGARRWGVGAGAAHLLSGHTRAHAVFEESLADFLGCEAALVFSTGYMANLGAIGTVVGRGDTVVEDRLNHASLIDGALLARARLLRYEHGTPQAAAERLELARGRKMLVTDGVFSMDGDLAPLPALAKVAHKTDAIFMVDDAHGFGVLGVQGKGSMEHFGLGAEDVQVHVVTLGKALGVFGAAVAGSRVLVDALVQRARPWIYTTALPPALAEALTASLELLRREQWRRVRVLGHVARFRERAAAVGLPLVDSVTPIQPVMIGGAARAVAVASGLADQGFYVPAIRPPTVPEGSARLRIVLSAAHDDAHIDRLIAALATCVEATSDE